MASDVADLVALFDFAFSRFERRMAGLTDIEWRWTPVHDPRIGLRWRLQHVTDLLRERRNGPWLGLPAGPAAGPRPTSAASALAEVGAAYTLWREQLLAMSDDAVAEPVGEVAGPYGTSTRRSFVLHVADELIHHTAEAALLRDLYAGRSA